MKISGGWGCRPGMDCLSGYSHYPPPQPTAQLSQLSQLCSIQSNWSSHSHSFVVVWFTLIITSIIAGTRPASTTHWIWWGHPAVIFEIVQAASCKEKDRVHMEIIKVHTSFCSHLMLINFVVFFSPPWTSYVHTVSMYTGICSYMKRWN